MKRIFCETVKIKLKSKWIYLKRIVEKNKFISSKCFPFYFKNPKKLWTKRWFGFMFNVLQWIYVRSQHCVLKITIQKLHFCLKKRWIFFGNKSSFFFSCKNFSSWPLQWRICCYLTWACAFHSRQSLFQH